MNGTVSHIRPEIAGAFGTAYADDVTSMKFRDLWQTYVAGVPVILNRISFLVNLAMKFTADRPI